VSSSDQAGREGGELGLPLVPVRRVRKAYEQVADQLRELILRGELPVGGRLPSESALAAGFGVSRATVREALRVLAAQSLIRTAKGPAGGSYVTLPTVDHISAFVHTNVGLLTRTRQVSLEELLEARELLEVPAARLAAQRRSNADLERLRGCVAPDQLALPVSEQFDRNRDFHATVLEACGNALFTIAALPIFSVLQTNLRRSGLGRQFHRGIHDQHLRIIDAVAAGDADGAETEMREHLRWLRPFYERAWRDARGRERAARAV
jgi:GntR family transcriptional repressor for pyruvate dehydrogenase complex